MPLNEHLSWQNHPLFLVDSLPQIVWITDSKGEYLFMNQKWENYSGEKPGADSWMKVIHPDDLENTNQAWQRALSSGQQYSAEFRLRSRSGDYRWFMGRGLPIRGQNHQIIQWAGTLTDIHEQKETEEKLRATETQLQTIFDSAGVGVAITEPLSGKILQANRTLSEMSGYSIDELLKLSYREITHPEDLPDLTEDQIKKALDRSYQFRRRFIKKNGELIWIHVNTTKFSDQPLRSIAVVQDVTKEQMATFELQRSEQKFKSFASLLPQILWSAGADGTIDYVNDRWVEFSGLDADSVSINTWENLIHEEDFSNAVTRWHKALSRGESYEMEYRLWDRKSQSYRWFLTRSVPIKNEEGRALRWIGTSTDIEDQKKAVEARHQALLAIESSRLKSEFLANMSHEIRTPLHGIIGMTQLLRETPLNQEQREYLETTQICAQGLLDLVNDILDYSKIDADKLQLDSIEFNLKSLARDVERILSPQAQKKGLKLSLKGFEKSQPLMGDPKRIRQIFINLISNAIKFSCRGQVEVSVQTLWESKEQTELRFEVRDEGIGIASEHIHHLFQPFYQVDSSMSRKFEGSGLGLSICKKLVESMGGQIGVQSEVGRGSQFWFVLRLQKAPDRILSESSYPTPELRKSLTPSARVLVVEDNIVNQKFALALLKKMGLQHQAVANGKEAIEALFQSHFDLILMDCQMPQMDGYEATRTIRRTHFDLNDSQIPIVAITANAMPENRTKCLESGMNDFLTKPLSHLELSNALMKWLPQPETTVRQSMLSALKNLAQETSPETCATALTQFKVMAQSYLESMQIEKDLRKIIEVAQSLRSTAEMLGAQSLALVLREIEEIKHPESVMNLIQKLKAELERVFQEIPKLLPSLQS